MVHFGRRIAVAFLCLCAGRLQAAPWPEVQSDLPPDPAVRWGTLPNGVRYAVRPNAEPPGRVSLRLLVAAGSAEERDDEQGLAHFIEHMAFRGTRTHPGDSLTTQLQRLGMGFGPDTTAFTSLNHTIYHLDLPDNSAATVQVGLEVFREYAEEITFDPVLIERERDVILNERDTRDTPGARVEKADMEMLWPDSLAVLRRPIGLPGQIRTFKREQFVDFYNAWYRPDRLAVIIVGDIDPAVAIRLTNEVLGPLAARGPARPEVDLVPGTASVQTTRIYRDVGLLGAQYMLIHPFADPINPDTHARRLEKLQRYLALGMLQRRADRIPPDKPNSLISPFAGIASHPVRGWSSVYFGATSEIGTWAAHLTALEQQRRAAAQFGFDAAELDLARAATATAYEQATRSFSTWRSDWLATELADSMIEGVVFATAAARQHDLAADLAKITPADCTGAFRAVWGRSDPHLFISANPSFAASFVQVAKVVSDSWRTPVAPPPAFSPPTFAYPVFTNPAAPAESRHVEDLDVWQARYPNGVRLNFKSTPFDANTVFICVRVGTGRLTEPPHHPSFDLLANTMMSFGGLGRHSFQDLQDILSAHAIGCTFGVDSDALQFSLRCAPSDLFLSLRLVTAYLADAGFRTESAHKAQAAIGDTFSALASSPSGPIEVEACRVLTGGDDRFAGPTQAAMNLLKPAEIRSWLEAQLRHGPIEVAIVGDASWPAASSAVGGTLGALARRSERSPEMTFQTLHVPDHPSKPVYLATSDASLRQVALAWFCPAPDVRTNHEVRRCRLLAAVLAERLRLRLREELGAAYVFDAEFMQQEGFLDFNYFGATTTVSPQHARRANELIQEEIARLATGEVTEDEFKRVRQPFLQSWDKDQRDNTYWCYTVLARAQLHPDNLAAARDRTPDCAAITRADLAALAGRYFGASHWFQFVAFPQARDPANQIPAFAVPPRHR